VNNITFYVTAPRILLSYCVITEEHVTLTLLVSC